MDKEGAKRVEIVGVDDKRQITAVLAGSLSGDYLPPRLILLSDVYQLRNFPQDGMLHTAWANERLPSGDP